MLWANTAEGRVKATSRARGLCPGCGAEVIARCGQVVTHHWAHRAGLCPREAERETDWHRHWKERFPAAMQEVTIENRRADVKTPCGVIEFQHSSITAEEIRDRERDYGNKMWWVIDMAKAHLYFLDYNEGNYGQSSFTWSHRKRAFDASHRPIVFDVRENPGKPKDHPGLVMIQAYHRDKSKIRGARLSPEQLVSLAQDPDALAWSKYTHVPCGDILHAQEKGRLRIEEFRKGYVNQRFEISPYTFGGLVVFDCFTHHINGRSSRDRLVLGRTGFEAVDARMLNNKATLPVFLGLPSFNRHLWSSHLEWALHVQKLYMEKTGMKL